MSWYIPLLTIGVCVAMCTAWFRLGRAVQERRDISYADRKILEMTNGQAPAATVTVHIVTPTQMGVACEVYDEVLSDKTEKDPTLVMRVAAVALANAIDTMDEREADHDSAREVAGSGSGSGPYL